VREAVRTHIAQGLERAVFPGAVVAVVWRDARLVLDAFGRAQVTPRRRAMTTQTIFDLASLTKAVATTTAILQLRDQGTIDLDAPVAAYLPRFADGGKAAATVRHLLSHTAGLPAWEMLYLPGPAGESVSPAPACRSIEEAVARICGTPATSPPGTRVEYSDLGFIVLGYLIGQLSGLPLDRYARRRIFQPLGMTWSRFAPPRSWRARCAATELGNAFERSKAAEQGLGRRFAWRTHLLRGEVHDGNSWYLGQGVAGHAGMFGTAGDLVRFGVMVLRGGVVNGAHVVSRGALAEATQNQTSHLDAEPRGLGWALKGSTFLGTHASHLTIGHTGFTGTSLLIDPARDVVIALLTNRVHPHVDSAAIQEFRPAFHDAVIQALDG
jgi:CubicO group peptidase (beta-lactamase class C family)